MDTCRERNDQCQLRIVRGRITHMDEPGLFRASRPRCEEKEKRKQERKRWVLVFRTPFWSAVSSTSTTTTRSE